MSEVLGGLTPSQISRVSALLHWHEQVGRYVIPPPNRVAETRNPPPFFLGQANATISAGGSGNALLWSSTTAGGSAEASLGTTETVYSFGGQTAESGDDLYIFRHWRSGQLYFINTEKDLGTVVADSSDISGYSTEYYFPVISQTSSGGMEWIDLNSSKVTGYSTAVSLQVFVRSSTGVYWASPSTCA